MFDRAISARVNPSVRGADLEVEMADPALLMQLMRDHLQLGVWRLEIPSGDLLWSKRVFEIYGQPYHPGPVDPAIAIGSLLAEDRQRAGDVMVAAIKEKTGFEYRLRILTGQGKIRVIDCVGGVELAPNGAVRAAFGTLRDVTDRAQVEELSSGRSGLLRSLLKNVPAAIAVVDSSMIYLAVSDHWLAGHGHRSASELIGKSHYLLRPEITAAQKAEHQRVLAGEVVRSTQAYLKDRVGHPISQMCTMAPWVSASGEVGGMIMMLPTVDQSMAFKEAVPPELVDDEPRPTMHEFMSLLQTVS